MKEDIGKALEVLNAGGLILYPTDTIWGIGCDATNPSAVEKVFKLKGRDAGKSLIVLLDTDNKLESYLHEVPPLAYDLIEYAEKPLTIIYSGAKNLAPNLIHADGSVGIRVARHEFCQKLIHKLRRPLVSTSANISGEKSPANFDEVSEEIKNGVDYVVQHQQQDTTQSQPSTIMKLEADGKFVFIRK